MKKIIFTLILLLILPNTVIAQETTPTTAPSGNQIPENDKEIEQVQRIKDIVASKVAELNLVEKKGIIGTVKESSNTKLTVEDTNGENIDIDVDELTKFDFEDDDFGISDLESDVVYSFVGLYNRDTDRLLARFISQPDSIPVHLDGAISDINEDDFQIEVISLDGKKTLVDIEKSTNTMIVNDGGELEESGFSELSNNQRVIVIGFETDDNTISATRVIHFVNIPPSAELLSKLEDETNVATGSGNKLEIIETEIQE